MEALFVGGVHIRIDVLTTKHDTPGGALIRYTTLIEGGVLH